VISRIHQKLGTAGFIISIVALVAALGGGAYAASGGLNGKQKKEVEKIAKKYAGKPGAAGPAGPAGTKGDSGTAGSNGTNGSNGVDGASATVEAFTGSKGTCTAGGATVKGTGSEANVCNGKNGQPGLNGSTVLNGTGNPAGDEGEEGDFYIKTGSSPEIYGPKTESGWGSATSLKGPQGAEGNIKETLPRGTQLKGTWVAGPFTATAAGNPVFTSGISFGIPTETNLSEAIYMKEGEVESPEFPVSPPFRYCNGGVVTPNVALTSNEFVSAGTTVLCIFTSKAVNWEVERASFTFGVAPARTNPGTPTTGLIVEGQAEGPGVSYAFGTWAVKTVK
jgi:hypothetical protein